MRVTGGIARGRKLRVPSGGDVRPTTDMARKTIFDILGNRVDDARVLDLFAGSGALGIEALSRGASSAVFVEQNREACSTIESNLKITTFTSAATLRRSDVMRVLAGTPETAFDLAFLDPPYSRGLGFVSLVLGSIAAGSWVRNGGTVVVEAEVGHLEWPLGFRETRTRRFGRTQVYMAVMDDSAAKSDLSRNV